MDLRDSVGHKAGQRHVKERRCGRHEVAVEQRAQASKYVRRGTQRPAHQQVESMQQGSLLHTLPLEIPKQGIYRKASPFCLLQTWCSASITCMQYVLAIHLHSCAAHSVVGFAALELRDIFLDALV